MKPAGLSHRLTVSLYSPWQRPACHPWDQNYCVSADQIRAADLGNASVAAHPCDDHRNPACRDAHICLVADRRYAVHRSESLPGHGFAEPEGTSFQTEAEVRKVRRDLCWRENNPTHNQNTKLTYLTTLWTKKTPKCSFWHVLYTSNVTGHH